MTMHACKFIKNETYWCSHCDTRKVLSDDPATGTFFSQFGHEWDPDKKHTTDAYTQIIFAYCPGCIELLGLQKLIDYYDAEEKTLATECGLDVG